MCVLNLASEMLRSWVHRGAEKHLRRAVEIVARQIPTAAQRTGGAQQVDRRQIEYAFRFGMVAVFRIVARHEQEVADTEQAGAKHVSVNGEPVTVPHGDVHNGLASAILEQE